jgi:hypothetical protein
VRVRMAGHEPEAIDFANPARPPGLNAGTIHHRIKVALEDMRSRGWTAEQCFIRPDDQAGLILKQMLTSGSFDCPVSGRLPSGAAGCPRLSATRI